MDFTQIKALTFDCFGTLIDWEAGILAVLRPWARRNGLLPADEELLECFARAEARRQRAMPGALYTDVLRSVMADIAVSFEVQPDPGDADRLAASVGAWPPFPDTHEALLRLKEKFKLVIISNVDRASFKRTNEKLGVAFDAVVTA